jgi:hypothetical protein
MPLILVLRRWSQEDHELKASLGYTVRSYLDPYSIASQKPKSEFVTWVLVFLYFSGKTFFTVIEKNENLEFPLFFLS